MEQMDLDPEDDEMEEIVIEDDDEVLEQHLPDREEVQLKLSLAAKRQKISVEGMLAASAAQAAMRAASAAEEAKMLAVSAANEAEAASAIRPTHWQIRLLRRRRRRLRR